ncbi:hypothetical protein GMD78_13340 [Ornithinibacillus sp. L9]|uniref:Uncharacterized protein n=1 Tax=Ornithinibacillus caprae TaxID=2678566 RepID=A0A6N8FKV9_9BACI|nr:hypothetical protein [Ornithinibacillus caprae]MUK89346.1 hypothetical protein [Ornithinibacillus caprae]
MSYELEVYKSMVDRKREEVKQVIRENEFIAKEKQKKQNKIKRKKGNRIPFFNARKIG